jgi:hypothetical protein
MRKKPKHHKKWLTSIQIVHIGPNRFDWSSSIWITNWQCGRFVGEGWSYEVKKIRLLSTTSYFIWDFVLRTIFKADKHCTGCIDLVKLRSQEFPQQKKIWRPISEGDSANNLDSLWTTSSVNNQQIRIWTNRRAKDFLDRRFHNDRMDLKRQTALHCFNLFFTAISGFWILATFVKFMVYNTP